MFWPEIHSTRLEFRIIEREVRTARKGYDYGGPCKTRDEATRWLCRKLLGRMMMTRDDAAWREMHAVAGKLFATIGEESGATRVSEKVFKLTPSPATVGPMG